MEGKKTTDSGREGDRRILARMGSEALIELLLSQMRSLWTVDGLYFLGIEERFGTEAATGIDRNVWEVMGKLEARRLKEIAVGAIEGAGGGNVAAGDGKSGAAGGGKSGAGEGGDGSLAAMTAALRLSSWALDLEDKEILEERGRTVFRNRNCRVQMTRLKKGLPVFHCKPVRRGYLESFAREFDPRITVKCNLCPPDATREDLWCEWEFTLEGDGGAR